MDSMFYQPEGSQEDNQIMSMVEELENGNEPLLLRIINGKATQEEIDEWAKVNDIQDSELNDVLVMLGDSFNVGSNLAKDMVDKEEIREKLDKIIDRLDDLKSEISLILNLIK